MSSFLLLDTPASNALVIFHCLISSVIVLRLLTYRRGTAQYRLWGGWVAYTLIIFYSWGPLRLITGHPVVTEWPQIGIDIFMLVMIVRSRGNVVRLFSLEGRKG